MFAGVTALRAASAVVIELEDAIKDSSSEKRVETLRRVTDLFLTEADRLNEEQIGVFDDVLLHLMERIEKRALVQLSTRLAPLDNAPIEVVRQLARDEEIAVAGPVLGQSSRLTDGDLIEISQSRGQAHLLAISGRASLNAAVTDVLVQRGNNQVAQKLARNAGARFSDFGYASLVKRAEADESLAEGLGCGSICRPS